VLRKVEDRVALASTVTESFCGVFFCICLILFFVVANYFEIIMVFHKLSTLLMLLLLYAQFKRSGPIT